jgi:hypothetical protein
MTTIVSTSTEYVWVPVRSEHPTLGAANLLAYGVDVAFVRAGDPQTGDWQPATWEAAATSDGYYLAKVKVGPAGAVTLDDGAWNVYIRLTTGDQQPVVRAGTVLVT